MVQAFSTPPKISKHFNCRSPWMECLNTYVYNLRSFWFYCIIASELCIAKLYARSDSHANIAKVYTVKSCKDVVYRENSFSACKLDVLFQRIRQTKKYVTKIPNVQWYTYLKRFSVVDYLKFALQGHAYLRGLSSFPCIT